MKKLVSLVVLTFVLVGCNTRNTSSPNKTDKQTTDKSVTVSDKNQERLDFTIKDKDKKDVKLSDFKGKKIYLNVWASWCGYCKAEMPELEKVYQTFKDKEDYVFLSVTSPSDKEFANTNPADDSKETILSTAKQAGVTFPVLFDTNDQAMSALSISAFPTHYFINSDGSLHDIYMGGLNEKDLIKFLEEMK